MKWRELEASTAKQSSSHVSDGVCDGIQKLELVGRKRGGISGTLNKCSNKIMENRMQISRALRSKKEENIGGVVVVFGVISNL